jgi:hypothetical protein
MSDHCPHDDDAVSWKRSPYGRSYRVCGECESERDPRAPAREQAEPTPIRMEGARSVCYRAGRESVVRDWPSVEEAASLPLPCGPGCRGVHVVVSVVDGRWRVRSPRPAPPELSDLYRWTAPAKAVDEPRRWPTPFGLNGPLRRGQPWPPLPPDPDAVRRPTAALGGMTRRGLTAGPDLCRHGHVLDAANVYVRRDGRRRCRACRRATDRRPRRMARHAELQRHRRRAAA